MPKRAGNGSDAMVRVWDICVRLFHWALVISLAIGGYAAFEGGATWTTAHVAGGLTAAGLVLARIVWGFFGPTHARFADFIPRPRAVLRHLIPGRAVRHLGHNPLGGLMVLVLIAGILALAVTGIGALGSTLRTGPLAPFLAYADGGDFRGLHSSIGYALLVLVGLHLAGVVFESLRSRENLARAMVTGLKARRDGGHAHRPRPARPWVALALVAVLGTGLVLGNAELSALPRAGAPAAELDPVYASECGDCHMAYHPSLLKAETWRAMIAALDDHFGEDASLDDATAARIADWLAANAAETADTKPSHLLSRTSAEAPFAITGTRFWKRAHHGLRDRVFRAAPVRSRANCEACHEDAATGMFSPLAISLPEEIE